MFAKTSFIIFLAVLVAVASSFVSIQELFLIASCTNPKCLVTLRDRQCNGDSITQYRIISVNSHSVNKLSWECPIRVVMP